MPPVRLVLQAKTKGYQPCCGWTKSCTTLKPWEIMVCWYIYREVSIRGFLRWCRISSIHRRGPQNGRNTPDRLSIASVCSFWSRWMGMQKYLGTRKVPERLMEPSLTESQGLWIAAKPATFQDIGVASSSLSAASA